MNNNEFDRTARAWLDDGPTRMSDRALLSTLEEIHTTRQRRALWPAWRAAPVFIFARAAGAAVLVVAVGLLANNVVRQPDGSSVGGPSPSTSPAQAVDFPNLTTTFVSPRNGFVVKHPDRAAVTPATQMWVDFEQNENGFDVVETGLAAVFEGTSTGGVRPDGRSVETIDEYVSGDYVLPGGCGVPISQQAEITIDGQSGRIVECANRIEATVVAGGRLYLFTLTHDRSDARALLDAYVATIDLRPETAVDIPAMAKTFVSPTYGFSFGYDRGLAPATEFWDPANQPARPPIDDILGFDPRFDAVETGLGANFLAASTPIPDGVSIDEWVDEHATPLAAGGCGVPRTQQAEITIDGQSGSIAECDHTEATVVAGGRLYLFLGPGESRRDREWFHAWVATIDLRPEDAAVPSISPSS